jgi:hypothetical protein
MNLTSNQTLHLTAGRSARARGLNLGNRLAMSNRRNIAAMVVAASLACGCATPYLAEQQQLALKRDRGEITEQEYQQALRRQRKSQPWGGVGGVHEQPPAPLIITIPYDEREIEFLERQADMWAR